MDNNRFNFVVIFPQKLNRRVSQNLISITVLTNICYFSVLKLNIFISLEAKKLKHAVQYDHQVFPLSCVPGCSKAG